MFGDHRLHIKPAHGAAMRTVMEHRWGQRVTATLPVTIVVDRRRSGMGRVKNVSVSGALLETPIDIPINANVSISPSGKTLVSGEICGCVVRTLPGGFAVEWRDMASPPVIALMESISPDSGKCDRRDPYAA
jgi:hypothetical protein